jgi:hypothetical protein
MLLVAFRFCKIKNGLLYVITHNFYPNNLAEYTLSNAKEPIQLCNPHRHPGGRKVSGKRRLSNAGDAAECNFGTIESTQDKLSLKRLSNIFSGPHLFINFSALN